MVVFSLNVYGETSNDIKRLAGILFAEAPNEGYYCKSLVATVIWVRADQEPINIKKVITIPKQFATPIYGSGDKWNECMQIAKEMYNDTFKSQSVILGNGTVIQPDHFFHGKAPWWAVGRIWKKVDGLKFLRLDSYRKGAY